MTTRGHFITLEGGEGVGKSTQAALLAEALRAGGEKVVLTREPGGTPGAEAIRALLLGDTAAWMPRAEALLFAAARAEHVARLISPALARGAWVVCDRFIDSSRAYQAGGFAGDTAAPSDAEIMAVHAAGSGLVPDLTLLLELPAAVAAARVAARDGANSDAIGRRTAAYHARVAAAFAAMANAEPARFRRIDAGQPVDTVHQAIVAAVASLRGRTP